MSCKRQFGNIRPLQSGRFQARFTAPDGSIVKAPRTFESKKRADDWPALQHAALLRQEWIDPNLGALTLGEYAQQWLEDRKEHIESSTYANYSDHIRRFVTGPYPQHDVSAPNPQLGDVQLRHITVGHIAQWHRWVRDASAAGAAARTVIKEGSPRSNRAWASSILCDGRGRWPARRGVNVAGSTAGR